MSDRVERYFNSLGKTIVLQTKKSLRKKKGSTSLGESIKYKVVKNPNGYTLQFYMEDYGTFLDKGVSGNKRKQQYKDYLGKTITSPYKYTSKGPPIDILSKWIKKKGIKPKGIERGRSKVTGQYISGLAYYISAAIKRDGIKSLSFFQTPLGSNLKQFNSKMLDAVTEDIIDGLTEVGFKKE